MWAEGLCQSFEKVAGENNKRTDMPGNESSLANTSLHLFNQTHYTVISYELVIYLFMFYI